MKFLFTISLILALALAQNLVQNAELNEITSKTEFSKSLQKFASDDFKRELIKQFTMCTGECKEICQLRIKHLDNNWSEKDLENCHYYACGCSVIHSVQEEMNANVDIIEENVESTQEEEEEETRAKVEEEVEDVLNQSRDLQYNGEEEEEEETIQAANLIIQANELIPTQELIDSSSNETSIVSVLIGLIMLYAIGVAFYKTCCRYEKLFSRKQEESYLILNDTDHYQRLY